MCWNMGNESRNYPTYIVGDQLKKNKAQKETVAHGLRNSGKHAMINADVMSFSKKLITTV
jgi:hypothetical protein